jgi:hypothetical protein
LPTEQVLRRSLHQSCSFRENALRSSRFGCNNQVCGTPPSTRRYISAFPSVTKYRYVGQITYSCCHLYGVPTSTHDQRAILISSRTLSNGERCLFTLSKNLGSGSGPFLSPRAPAGKNTSRVPKWRDSFLTTGSNSLWSSFWVVVPTTSKTRPLFLATHSVQDQSNGKTHVGWSRFCFIESVRERDNGCCINSSDRDIS